VTFIKAVRSSSPAKTSCIASACLFKNDQVSNG